LISGGKLIYDTYHFPQTTAIIVCDYIITGIFIVEFIIKVVHKGMLTGRGCYLEDGWNKLAFVIIVSNIVDAFVEADLSLLKILRVLRPLRMISKHSKVKVIIQSLTESIAGLANVSLLLVLVFLIFSITFVNLLQGKLNYCDMGNGPNYGPYGMGQNLCVSQGYQWRTQEVNFDNVYRGLLSLYIFSTRENWPYYYYTFVDADDQV
jgi:hypothetical protein